MQTARPQVLCVEKNVARVARSFLRDANVTVVCNMKRCVMQRIVRCTYAEVSGKCWLLQTHKLQLITSVETQIGLKRLGKCGCFYTTDVRLKNGTMKTLMFFDDCEPNLSAAILLQYGDRKQLVVS